MLILSKGRKKKERKRKKKEILIFIFHETKPWNITIISEFMLRNNERTNRVDIHA